MLRRNAWSAPMLALLAQGLACAADEQVSQADPAPSLPAPGDSPPSQAATIPAPASPEPVQDAVDPDRYVVTPGGEAERTRHNFFYRDGTPAGAKLMLEAFVRDEAPALMADARSGDAERATVAAERILQRIVFFTGAARGRPEVLRAYEDVARAVPGEQVEIVIKLLAHAGDAETTSFLRRLAEGSKDQPVAAFISETLRGGVGPTPEIESARRAPITGGAQLDLRWVEFMATGDTAHLADILSVLEWPDRVRDHLQPLLAASPADGSAAIERALEPLGFRFDPRTHALRNRDDLDLRAIVRDGRLDGARFKTFVDALPGPLPIEVAVAATTKASAMWSLASNAAEHPTVLAACEAAAAERTGAARLSLLEILATAHERRGDLIAAERVWAVYRTLDPERSGLADHLEVLALSREFAALEVADGARTDLPLGQAIAAARRSTGQSPGDPAYHVRLRHERLSEPESDEQMTESKWRARVAGQDIEVWRAFWTRKEGGLADEWLDVAGQHFIRGPDMWIRTRPDFDSRAADNALMRIDRFAALLRERTPDRGRTLAGPVQWIELIYDAGDIGELSRLDVPPGPYQVTLRIDAATYRLVRADVAPPAGAGSDFKAVFLFVTPARPFTLAAPSGALDMTQATPTTP